MIPTFHSFRGDGMRTSKCFIGGHNLTHNTYLLSRVYSEEMTVGNIKRKLTCATTLANMDYDTYTVTCMGLGRKLRMVILRLSPEDTQRQRRRNATPQMPRGPSQMAALPNGSPPKTQHFLGTSWITFI